VTRRRICASADLADGGAGWRFDLPGAEPGTGQTGFLVRYRGRVYGWINRCPHRGLELDWLAGQFFDAAGEMLICATHGARFAPDSGRCVDGPCGRDGLQPLAVNECDGGIFLVDAPAGGMP